jgi:hypothetical protein
VFLKDIPAVEGLVVTTCSWVLLFEVVMGSEPFSDYDKCLFKKQIRLPHVQFPQLFLLTMLLQLIGIF